MANDNKDMKQTSGLIKWSIGPRPGREGRWQARKQFGRNLNGKPNIKAFYGRSREEVEEKALDYECKLRTNQLTNNPKTTVYNYIKEWLETAKKYDVKAKTYDGLEDTLENRLKPFDIAYVQMKNITPFHCRKYINQLVESPKKYSRATIRKSYDLLNAAFKDAVENNDIPKNPMKSVKMPSEDAIETKTKDIKFFTEEQMSKIFNEVCLKYSNGKPHYYYGLTIEVLARTGIRVNEALALLWKDVDLKNKTLSINKTLSNVKNRKKITESDRKRIITKTYPKTARSSRIVKLSQKAVEVFENIKRQAVMYGLGIDADDNIFQTQMGNLVSSRNVQRTFDAILKNVGIYGEDEHKHEHYGLHTLRHTFATTLLSNGVVINVVSALLGHQKVSTTYNIYVHVIEAQEAQALDMLDDIL